VIRKIEETVEEYKYILKFHPVKYLGIAIMTFGPLYFIYRFIFLGSQAYELVFACLGFLVLGSFVWSLGWDPYA
jgi:hypothetical protein